MARLREQWTPWEDAFIVASLQYGHGWARISTSMGLHRSADAIRNRAHRLGHTGGGDDPGAPSLPRLRRAPSSGTRVAWTRTEDRRLLYAVAENGLRWGRIEGDLPGRNAHAIRNRHARLLAETMCNGHGAAEDVMLTIANYL